MIKNLKKNESGQALVEFALVLPILIALILGMIEFGWILNGEITLTSAAREGARTAIIYESATQASTAVQNAVRNSSMSSSLTDVTASTSFDDTTNTAIINATAKIKPIIGLFFNTDIDLSAKAQMRIE